MFIALAFTTIQTPHLFPPPTIWLKWRGLMPSSFPAEVSPKLLLVLLPGKLAISEKVSGILFDLMSIALYHSCL
jgi:hypothetical protein